jgi:protein-S-isoprenylcysteine O-methyltransferase Ste14
MTDRSLMRSSVFTVTLAFAVVLWALAAMHWRVNGWGAIVWLLSFAATCVIRTPYGARNQANTIALSRKDTSEKVLLIGMFGTAMVLPLIHLATGLFAFADYRLGDSATIVGALLLVPYLILFWRSHADLGRNWSPGLEVRDRHELISRGIYARIRHPMYAAIWLSSLAQPLLIHNWIAGFLVVPAFAAMWLIRVPQEEAMMRDAFGEAYVNYCRRTGRLFPRSMSRCH